MRRAAAAWLQVPTLEAIQETLSSSLEPGQPSLDTCALLHAFSAAVSIAALDKVRPCLLPLLVQQYSRLTCLSFS